ncbi:MAG: GGDEF domain-containing protein [Candidatus Cloacimonadota bacterium]|nr:MAG: GGDEF domain-containing protein [Candidatus Cloacimonadota bacterium]
MTKKSGWGVLLFALGLILLVGGYWFLNLKPPRFDTDIIKKVFFCIGIATGVVVPLLGYLSYPRVHNLKVYLAGYLTGVGALSFFLLGPSGLFSSPIPGNFIPGLYLFIIAAIFLSTVLPTFLKYRHTKSITITLLLIEMSLIYVLRTTTIPVSLLHSLRHFHIIQWANLIPAAAALLSLLFSVYVLKLQFYLGGVLGGTMLLFCGGWYLGPRSVNLSIFDSYIFAATPLFLGVGILVHWIARMEHRASYDPLLRIYNRSYCEKVLSEQIPLKTSPPFGIAIVDIDRFKKVNDTYGHKIGDEVLIQVARILTNELVPQGIVCRYGGDEFVVFFPGKNSTKIKIIVEKARKSVKAAVIRSGKKKIRVTLSIGISHRKNTIQSLPEVLKTADKALYRAKKHGRNQVRFSKTSQNER